MISKAEWDTIGFLGGKICDAYGAGRAQSARFWTRRKISFIRKLQTKYGDSPLFWEIIADTTKRNKRSIKLYKKIIQSERLFDYPTYSARVSLAGIYADQFHRYKLADRILKETILHAKRRRASKRLIRELLQIRAKFLKTRFLEPLGYFQT